MNHELLLIRIFVIDPEDNREELDLGTPLMRALLRSIAECKAWERFKPRLDEDQSR